MISDSCIPDKVFRDFHPFWIFPSCTRVTYPQYSGERYRTSGPLVFYGINPNYAVFVNLELDMYRLGLRRNLRVFAEMQFMQICYTVVLHTTLYKLSFCNKISCISFEF